MAGSADLRVLGFWLSAQHRKIDRVEQFAGREMTPSLRLLGLSSFEMHCVCVSLFIEDFNVMISDSTYLNIASTI